MNLLLSVLTSISCNANAFEHDTPIDSFDVDTVVMRQIPIQIPKNLDWKVGDFQDRQIKKSFIKAGTLKSWVDREEGSAFWLLNELKIITKPKQMIEILIDRQSGKALRYIVDGKEKTPPDLSKPADCIDLDQDAEKIKTPAGTFQTTRTVTRCPKDTVANWTTPQMNMGGMVKQAVLNENEDLNKPEYVVEVTRFGHL